MYENDIVPENNKIDPPEKPTIEQIMKVVEGVAQKYQKTNPSHLYDDIMQAAMYGMMKAIKAHNGDKYDTIWGYVRQMANFEILKLLEQEKNQLDIKRTDKQYLYSKSAEFMGSYTLSIGNDPSILYYNNEMVSRKNNPKAYYFFREVRRVIKSLKYPQDRFFMHYYGINNICLNQIEIAKKYGVTNNWVSISLKATLAKLNKLFSTKMDYATGKRKTKYGYF